MKRVKGIHSLQKRLDDTLSRAPSVASDIEMQSDFARYFCVLISGFLENAIVEIILEFTQKHSSPEVALFVQTELKYWTNPNCEKIAQILGSFDSDWRNQIDSFLVDERKEAVNSLVALRHQIAHGQSVGVSMSRAKKYYETAKEVVKFIDTLVLGG